MSRIGLHPTPKEPRQAGDLHQALAGRVFRFVDQGAVPDELVGAPPDECDEAQVHQQSQRTERAPLLDDELVDRQRGCQGQNNCVHPGPFVAELDRYTADEHCRHDESGQHEPQPFVILALIEYLD